DDVGDLCGMKAAQSLQRHQQLGRRHVAHEGLDVLPVEDGVAAEVGSAATREQAPQHRLRAAVDAGQVPALVAGGKDQVVRLNDSAFDHVNQVPAEHVRCKQHLAGPALESFGADGVRVQPDTTRLERVD